MSINKIVVQYGSGSTWPIKISTGGSVKMSFSSAPATEYDKEFDETYYPLPSGGQASFTVDNPSSTTGVQNIVFQIARCSLGVFEAMVDETGAMTEGQIADWMGNCPDVSVKKETDQYTVMIGVYKLEHGPCYYPGYEKT